MAVTVSDHLRISAGALDALGAFDAVLDVDTRLFIDPALLRATTASEFGSAATTLDRRFQDVMGLLQRSTRTGDAYWRAAERLFTFPELKGLCIGYSDVRGTGGSGMGEGLRAQILSTAKAVVDAGIEDPAFFELMGLLEEGVGADRISDMVGGITAAEIAGYSARVFTDLGVEDLRTVIVKNETFSLPWNPFNNSPILLVPRDILRDLPIAESWDEIDGVIAFNADLRARVNSIIGTAWRKARHYPKEYLKRRLLEDPALFREILDSYRKVPPRSYDFKADPAGEVVWVHAAREFAARFPMALLLPLAPSADDVMQVVLEICRQFAFLVDTGGLSVLLYRDDELPRRESFAQKLFYGIAFAYCKANDLDISPETNAGRGSVDFKFSHGARVKVVVEVKLTSNQDLSHGLEVQVEEYARAEQTDQRVYLVIDVDKTGAAARLERFRELVEEFRTSGRSIPVVMHADGRRKASASEYLPQ